jgi:hypothetical protein
MQHKAAQCTERWGGAGNWKCIATNATRHNVRNRQRDRAHRKSERREAKKNSVNVGTVPLMLQKAAQCTEGWGGGGNSKCIATNAKRHNERNRQRRRARRKSEWRDAKQKSVNVGTVPLMQHKAAQCTERWGGGGNSKCIASNAKRHNVRNRRRRTAQRKSDCWEAQQKSENVGTVPLMLQEAAQCTERWGGGGNSKCIATNAKRHNVRNRRRRTAQRKSDWRERTEGQCGNATGAIA